MDGVSFGGAVLGERGHNARSQGDLLIMNGAIVAKQGTAKWAFLSEGQ